MTAAAKARGSISAPTRAAETGRTTTATTTAVVIAAVVGVAAITIALRRLSRIEIAGEVA